MPLQEHLDRTLREWLGHYQETLVANAIRYKGVAVWKNVLDLWVYQEIIHETRPEVVVEIGCKYGGSALWFADLMRTVGPGRVVAVDLIQPAVGLPENVHFIQGDSVSSQTVARVRDLCRGQRTMVVADSDHAADHVLQELRLYGPLVAPGHYFVVEDGVVDALGWEKFTPGPAVAVRRFLGENSHFVVDRSREKFGLTYNPDGFLRRVS
jgi:cephalosporin hydroxylase